MVTRAEFLDEIKKLNEQHEKTYKEFKEGFAAFNKRLDDMTEIVMAR